MEDEAGVIETFTIRVPKLKDVSSQEGVARLSAILQGFGVDCELDSSGTHIIYGPEAEDETEEETEFVQTLIDIYSARFLVTNQ